MRSLFQVQFPGSSGLPEDVFINTFAFQGAEATLTEATANTIADELQAFYNATNAPGTGSLAALMTTSITRANCKIKAYDLLQLEPRVPVIDRTWTLNPSNAGADYPNEIACVLSINATLLPGANPRTHRGRIYIGPLKSETGGASGGDVRPQGTLLNRIQGAAVRLMGFTGGTWSIYSRKDDMLYDVTSGHVDNAFDIQRRRGLKASSRQSF